MYAEAKLVAMLRRRFAGGPALLGIGDDAALVAAPSERAVLLCSDLLVENVHFRRATHPPDSIGHRAVAVNVSDIGAMAGAPAYCLLSLAVPADLAESWIDAFFDGFEQACRRYGVHLIGGDCSAAESIFVDVSMVGWVRPGAERRRSGARPGDQIYVTGELGGSALGLQLLGEAGREHPAVRRHLFPEPRHGAALALAGPTTAMIDVSDGFSVDLAHVLEASNVGARIDASAIPRAEGASLELALHGGEDYELILTGRDLPGEAAGVRLTRVGEVVPATDRPRALLVTAAGETPLEKAAWQHFR